MPVALKDLILSKDPRQALRMSRHLAALVAILLFTTASIYFSYNNMLKEADIQLLDINLTFCKLPQHLVIILARHRIAVDPSDSRLGQFFRQFFLQPL